eukprot:gene1471-15902_t
MRQEPAHSLDDFVTKISTTRDILNGQHLGAVENQGFDSSTIKLNGKDEISIEKFTPFNNQTEDKFVPPSEHEDGIGDDASTVQNEVSEIVPYSVAENRFAEMVASHEETDLNFAPKSQEDNEFGDTEIYPYPTPSELEESVEIEVILSSNSPQSGARKYQAGKYIGEVEDSLKSVQKSSRIIKVLNDGIINTDEDFKTKEIAKHTNKMEDDKKGNVHQAADINFHNENDHSYSDHMLEKNQSSTQDPKSETNLYSGKDKTRTEEVIKRELAKEDKKCIGENYEEASGDEEHNFSDNDDTGKANGYFENVHENCSYSGKNSTDTPRKDDEILGGNDYDYGNDKEEENQLGQVDHVTINEEAYSSINEKKNDDIVDVTNKVISSDNEMSRPLCSYVSNVTETEVSSRTENERHPEVDEAQTFIKNDIQVTVIL